MLDDYLSVYPTDTVECVDRNGDVSHTTSPRATLAHFLSQPFKKGQLPNEEDECEHLPHSLCAMLSGCPEKVSDDLRKIFLAKTATRVSDFITCVEGGLYETVFHTNLSYRIKPDDTILLKAANGNGHPNVSKTWRVDNGLNRELLKDLLDDEAISVLASNDERLSINATKVLPPMEEFNLYTGEGMNDSSKYNMRYFRVTKDVHGDGLPHYFGYWRALQYAEALRNLIGLNESTAFARFLTLYLFEDEMYDMFKDLDLREFDYNYAYNTFALYAIIDSIKLRAYGANVSAKKLQNVYCSRYFRTLKFLAYFYTSVKPALHDDIYLYLEEGGDRKLEGEDDMDRLLRCIHEGGFLKHGEKEWKFHTLYAYCPDPHSCIVPQGLFNWLWNSNTTVDIGNKKATDDPSVMNKIYDWLLEKVRGSTQFLGTIWDTMSSTVRWLIETVTGPIIRLYEFITDKAISCIINTGKFWLLGMLIVYFFLYTAGWIDRRTVQITINQTIDNGLYRPQAEADTPLYEMLIKCICVIFGLVYRKDIPGMNDLGYALRNWGCVADNISVLFRFLPRAICILLGYEQDDGKKIAVVASEWLVRTQALLELKGLLCLENSERMLAKINYEMNVYAGLCKSLQGSNLLPGCTRRANQLFQLGVGIRSAMSKQLPRMQPISIRLSGPAGLGKTLTATMIPKMLGLVPTQNVAQPHYMSIYTVQWADSYWNGFIEGMDDIIILDEMDQKTLADPRHSAVWECFTGILNHTPYQPPGAALEDKRKSARPSFFVTTGNSLYFQNTGSQDAKSIRRRVDFLLAPCCVGTPAPAKDLTKFKVSDLVVKTISEFANPCKVDDFIFEKSDIDSGEKKKYVMVYDGHRIHLCEIMVNGYLVPMNSNLSVDYELFRRTFKYVHFDYDIDSAKANVEAIWSVDDLAEVLKTCYVNRFTAFANAVQNNPQVIVDFDTLYHKKYDELLNVDPITAFNAYKDEFEVRNPIVAQGATDTWENTPQREIPIIEDEDVDVKQEKLSSDETCIKSIKKIKIDALPTVKNAFGFKDEFSLFDAIYFALNCCKKVNCMESAPLVYAKAGSIKHDLVIYGDPADNVQADLVTPAVFRTTLLNTKCNYYTYAMICLTAGIYEYLKLPIYTYDGKFYLENSMVCCPAMVSLRSFKTIEYRPVDNNPIQDSTELFTIQVSRIGKDVGMTIGVADGIPVPQCFSDRQMKRMTENPLTALSDMIILIYCSWFFGAGVRDIPYAAFAGSLVGILAVLFCDFRIFEQTNAAHIDYDPFIDNEDWSKCAVWNTRPTITTKNWYMSIIGTIVGIASTVYLFKTIAKHMSSSNRALEAPEERDEPEAQSPPRHFIRANMRRAPKKGPKVWTNDKQAKSKQGKTLDRQKGNKYNPYQKGHQQRGNFADGPKTIIEQCFQYEVVDGLYRPVQGTLFYQDYLLTYHHWINNAQNHTDEEGDYVLIDINNTKHKLYRVDPEEPVKNLFEDETNDIIIMKLGKGKFQQPRNCLSLFVTNDVWATMGNFNSRYRIPRVSDIEVHETVVLDEDIYYVDSLSNQEYTLSEGLCTKFESQSGDCGYLLMSLGYGLSQNKYVGMHVAGGEGIDGYYRSYAVPITREYLEEVLMDHFNEGITQTVNHRSMVITANSSYEMVKEKLQGNNVVSVTHLPPTEFVSLPRMSRYQATEFAHDPNFPHDQHPATLTIGDKDPIVEAMLEIAEVKEYPINEEILKECKVELLDYLRKTLFKEFPKRNLTDREVIAGIPKLLARIHLESSPGYPYVLIQKGKGKREFVDVDSEHIYMDSAFQKQVQQVESAMLAEDWDFIDQLDFRWMAYLKDEMRKWEKYYDCKTRVIFCNSLVFIYIFRKYFSNVMIAINKSFGKSIFGIGCNMTSIAAQTLYNYLTEKGFTNFIAGDYSSFDKNYHPKVQEVSYDILMELAQELGDVPDAMVKAFKRHEMCGRVQFEDILVEFKHCHMSGNFFTTQENCIQNCLYMMYCFKKHYPNEKFFDHVTPNFVGDDHILAVDNEVPEFNAINLYDDMKELGQKYTDENKQIPTEAYRDFFDCSYLGCSFRRIRAYDPVEHCDLETLVAVGCMRMGTLLNHLEFVPSLESLPNTIEMFKDMCSLYPYNVYRSYVRLVTGEDPTVEEYRKRQVVQMMRVDDVHYAVLAQGDSAAPGEKKTEVKKPVVPTKEVKQVKKDDKPIEKAKAPVKPKAKVVIKGKDETKKPESKMTTNNTKVAKPAHPKPRTNQVENKNYSMSAYTASLNTGPTSWMSIGTVTWTASSAVGTDIWSQPFPSYMVRSNPLSLQNFPFLYTQLWHGDIEIQIQMSGSQFTAGMLVAVWMPLTMTAPAIDECLTGTMIRLSPTDQTAATMTIPYRHFRTTLRCSEMVEGVNRTNLGSLHLMVMSKLNVADVTDTVSINIYARYKNPTFYLPRKPNVSQGDFSDLMGIFPGGTAAMTILDEAYDLFHTEMDEFITLDHPHCGGYQQPMQIQPPTINHTYGANHGMSMAHDPRMLSRGWQYCFDPAETKVSFLLSRQHVLRRFSWSSSNDVGSTLVSFSLDSFFRDAGGAVSTVYTNNMLTKVLNSFGFWHADFEFELYVVKTPLQNGRLRMGVDYKPRSSASVNTDPNFTYNQIMDFTQGNTIAKFTVPYCFHREWLETVVHSTEAARTSMGVVFINVANKLSANKSVVTDTVECILTVRLVNAKVAYPLPANIYGLTNDTFEFKLAAIESPASATSEEPAVVAQGDDSEPAALEEEKSNDPAEVGVEQPEESKAENEVSTGSEPVYNQMTMDRVKSVQFTQRNISDKQFKVMNPYELFPQRQFERVVSDYNELMRKSAILSTAANRVNIGVVNGSLTQYYTISPPKHYYGPWAAFGGGVQIKIISSARFTVGFSPNKTGEGDFYNAQNWYTAPYATKVQTGPDFQVEVRGTPTIMPDMVYSSVEDGSRLYSAVIYIPWWSSDMFGLYDSFDEATTIYGVITLHFLGTTSLDSKDASKFRMFIAGADDFSLGIYRPLTYVSPIPTYDYASGFDGTLYAYGQNLALKQSN